MAGKHEGGPTRHGSGPRARRASGWGARAPLLTALGAFALAPGHTAAQATLDQALDDARVRSALDHLDGARARTADFLVRIGGIVSPSGEEHDRAAAVAERMRTIGLDPIQIGEIRSLIAELASGDAQHTVVLSSHILAEVSAICRRVIMINEGRKTVDAPIEELVGDGRSLEELFARETARDVAAEATGDAE